MVKSPGDSSIGLPSGFMRLTNKKKKNNNNNNNNNSKRKNNDGLRPVSRTAQQLVKSTIC